MPEFKLPTVNLRGFRDMTTDDIKSALSDVPRPDVNLADIADAAIAATQAAAKAAQDAAAAAQSAAQSAAERTPIRQRQRSRRPLFVLGIIAASLGLLALANADRIRGWLGDMSQRARERMDAERVDDSLERIGSDEEAYSGAVGIPVQADAYTDTLPPVAPQEPTPSSSQQPAGYQSPYAGMGEGGSQPTEEQTADLYRR